METKNTKKLGQEPAFPTEVEYLDGKLQECFQTGNHTAQYSGISKRLYIATMAMQGFMNNSEWIKTLQVDDDFDDFKMRVCGGAFEFADEM